MSQTINPEISLGTREVLSEVLSVPMENIQESSKLREDLDLDSLFAAELAIELEKRFEVQFDDSQVPSFVTVGDLAGYIQSLATA